ncbi:MAG: aldehyde dehydrogenase family protein, partial [Micrococcales bacterium]|nr:aldehyde dehydrogenase family protein [Micrococcales bacterium]
MSELFIDGTWSHATDGATREIHCPADGSHVATVAEGGPVDAEAAVRAARRAFDGGPWPATSSLERGALLHRLADLLERDKADVARLETLDTGKRLVESEYDVDDIVSVFRHFAGLAGAESGRVVDTGRADIVSRVVHEPVGVCSLI